MTTTNRESLSCRNVYDPRVRELVRATGNPDLFPELKIPKSTLRGWLNGEFRTAVGTETVTQIEIELYSENAKLRRRVRVLQVVMGLLLVLIRVTGCRLDAYSEGFDHSFRQDSIVHSGGFDQGSVRSDE